MTQDNSQAVTNNNPNWIDSLTIEQIPEQYQHLAKIIGVHQLLELVRMYGGSNLYIPKHDALVRITRDNLIKVEYTGYNAKELAQKYGLTVRWVQEICKDKQLPGQVFFTEISESG